MSRIIEPTKEQERGWKRWVRSRPPAVRRLAERFEPWSLFRLRKTGQLVTVASFCENGTVSVDVHGRLNPLNGGITFNVFGVDPEELEPADPPAGWKPH